MTVSGNVAQVTASVDTRDVAPGLSPDRVAPLVLGALVLAVAVLTITPWPVGVFQDDGIYVVLAKALASGDGYRMINMPGAPHATHFPPGYPILLAAMWKVFPSFPDNIIVFKFVNALFLAGTAVGTYWFSRRRLDLGPLAAFLAAAVGTISVVVLMITGVVLSEPLYMLLAIPALFLAERAADDGDARSAAAAGALIGVLALVRTVGVFLLPAALVVMLVRRRWRSAAILLAVAMVFIVPWQLWISAHQSETPGPFVGKYGAYGPWLAEGYRAGGWPFAKAVLEKNADELFGFLGYITMPVPPVWPRLVSLGTLLGLAAVGASSVWRRVPITLVFLLGYGAVILVWPFEPTRFILVWWPILAALFVAGVRRVWQWRPTSLAPRALRWATTAAAVSVAVGYGDYNLRGARQKWWVNLQSDAGSRAKPIAEWVARATRPTDVVISDHDLIVYLYTGRRAVPTATFTALGRITPLTSAQDAVILRGLLAQLKPRWYIATSQQGIDAATLLTRDDPPQLRFAGNISTARVYEPVVK